MNKNLGFRSWYYFRVGWSTYFAFAFAAINTLVTTYYLAIEKVPSLKEIFSSFAMYVFIISVTGIPILVVIGYIHYKRSRAFQSENDILIESNPYQRRTIVNTELILQLMLKLLELNKKIGNNEKLAEDETKEISKLHDTLSDFVNSRTFSNNIDLDYLKKKK
jgi:hypothetical protein